MQFELHAWMQPEEELWLFICGSVYKSEIAAVKIVRDSLEDERLDF